MTDTPQPRVTVAYQPGVGPTSWQDYATRGETPDDWLYGLDKLGKDTVAVECEPLSAMQRASLLMRPKDSRVERRPLQGVILTWEERLAARASVRCLTPAMDSDLSTLSPRRHMNERVLRRCEALWALSDGQMEDLHRRYGRSVKHIARVQFGVDTNFFRPSPEHSRKRVVSLGTDQHRDWRTLANVFDALHSARPDVELMTQGAPHGVLPGHVKAVPWMTHEQLRNFYQRSSVVLLPTVHNLHVSGMTAACEAMASRRAVVATSTLGMEDYVQDGVTGRTVAPLDTAGFVDAVCDLLDSDADRTRMAHAARRFAERRLTSTNMVSQLGDLVAKII